MKKFIIISKIIQISFLTLITLISCNKIDDLKNPLDGFKVYINYDIFDTFITFRFIDTATNEIISKKDVLNTISGTHKDAVVDQLGNHRENHQSFQGLLSMALNPKAPYIPSIDNPIQFSIESSADSYQDKIFDIIIEETGFHYFDIYMEKESVLARGIKKYTRIIPLNNSALIDSFNLISSQGECQISIPKDVLLLDNNSNPVVDTFAIAELIVYNNINKAPIPNNLVTDVKYESVVEKLAYDPIKVISFSIETASAKINYTNNGEIDFTFGIQSDFTNPINNENLIAGTILPVFNYRDHWIHESDQIIKNNADSLYITFSSDHLSLFSTGILQQTCNYSGNILFNLSNEFPSQPIGTNVYCYRQNDSKYINHSSFDLTDQNLEQNFDFLVPIDNPVYLLIRQKSNTNGFVATPTSISTQYPCNQNYAYNVDLKSTSVNFQSQVKFHFVDPFPHSDFNIRVRFYNADNDSYLLSKVYSISSDKTISIDSGVPSDTKLYLKFSAVNEDNSFSADPARIYIEDSAIINQVWNVNLTPLNCLYNGNLNINYVSSFGSEDIELKLLFMNALTNTVIKQNILSFSPSTNLVPFSIVLPKNEQFKVHIMRTTTGPNFQAYPYEFDIAADCYNILEWDIDLSTALKQLITFNVTVDCPGVEILPTLQGFYRIVWEEDWHSSEIVDGFIEMMLEMNGTYEIGLIIDGEMKIKEYHVTDIINFINYELSDEECEKMGW